MRQAWRDDAACIEADTEIFFTETAAHVPAAMELFRSCPVMDMCLESLMHAAQFDIDDYGIYGGTTRNERKQMRRGVPPHVARKSLYRSTYNLCGRYGCGRKAKSQGLCDDHHAELYKRKIG